MKNYINYYYGMEVDNISYTEQKYTFNYAKKKYIFKECKNINIKLYYMELMHQLLKYQKFYKLIPNRNNNIITVINGKFFILLQVNNAVDEKIDDNDLNNRFYVEDINKLQLINHFPWHSFWEQKIDYIEEVFESKKGKYKKIHFLFSFFIGMAENALMYAKKAEVDDMPSPCDRLCFQHNRVNKNTTNGEYYDPINLIIDHSSRDISEYIKYNIFNSSFEIKQITDYLKKYNVSTYWLKMLYARIMFPSPFFDYIEEVLKKEKLQLNNAQMEKKIIDIIENLKQISIVLNIEYHIPTISWITKK